MKSSVQYRLAVGGSAVFAMIVGAAATLTIVSLAWPSAEGQPRLAEGQRRLAIEAFEARPPDIRAGDAAVRRLLAIAPADGGGWMLAGYADLAAGRGFGPSAVALIERSYAVMPYDPDVSSWRLRVLLEQWPEVPPSLRGLALAELAAKGRQARPVVDQIQNPSGRLAAEMVVPPSAKRR